MLITWILFFSSWALAAIVFWILKLNWDLQREVNAWKTWNTAHMIYEQDKGIPMMETERMGGYYQRANVMLKEMKKKRGGEGKP